MALVKGTNSYATAVEADTYFSDRLDVAAWTSADSTQKDQSLVTASSILDDQPWTGTAISENQPLAFPRAGYYFDPRVGDQVTLSPSAVPERILRAVKELAHHLLMNDGLLDDEGAVQSLSIGSLNLQMIQKPSLIPANVKRLIKPLLVNAGSTGWWRAN